MGARERAGQDVRMRRSLAPAALLLAGCVSSGTPLEVHERDVFVPNLRLSSARGGGAFELDFAQARAQSTQQLAPSEHSTLGSETFYGPQAIGTEARVSVLDAVGRTRSMDAEQKLGFEFLAGLGYARYDFAVVRGNRRFTDGSAAVGLVGGMGLVWRVLPSTSVQG